MRIKPIHLIKILLSVLIVSSIQSCMLGPKFQTPDLDIPETFLYDSTADSVVNLQWWDLFGDPLLGNLIDSALENNRDVRIAASRINEAMFIVGYNRADMLPSFSYDGSGSYGNFSGGMRLDDPVDFYSATGNVYWEVDFWGKYRSATLAAKRELLASEYGMRSIQVSLISDVASLYFQLIDYKNRLLISEQTLKTRQESLAIIQERFDEGIIPELDLNQAQIQEAIAAASVPAYERMVANTESALSILIGEYPHGIETAKFIDQVLPDSIPAGIPSELLTRRPDIQQAEQAYGAQLAKIGVAKALRFPSISITGALGAASSDLSAITSSDALIWSAAAGITGPVFNFGKNKRRVQIEKERAEQFLLVYKNTAYLAFKEVEDALIEVETLKREVEASKRRQIAAANAADLSRARYDGGVTSYLEVLETERSLFQSDLALSDAYQRQLVSYVKLYKALGGGWLTESEKLAAQRSDNSE